MPSVTFEGLTEEEANEFAKWYCGQGEQNADIWFDVNLGQSAPKADVSRDDGYKDVDENGNVTIYTT